MSHMLISWLSLLGESIRFGCCFGSVVPCCIAVGPSGGAVLVCWSCPQFRELVSCVQYYDSVSFLQSIVRNRSGDEFHVAGLVGASLCVCLGHLFAFSFTMCFFVRLVRIKDLVRFVAEGFLTSPFVGLFADATWDEFGPKDFHQDLEAGVVMEMAYVWM